MIYISKELYLYISYGIKKKNDKNKLKTTANGKLCTKCTKCIISGGGKASRSPAAHTEPVCTDKKWCQ